MGTMTEVMEIDVNESHRTLSETSSCKPGMLLSPRNESNGACELNVNLQDSIVSVLSSLKCESNTLNRKHQKISQNENSSSENFSSESSIASGALNSSFETTTSTATDSNDNETSATKLPSFAQLSLGLSNLESSPIRKKRLSSSIDRRHLLLYSPYPSSPSSELPTLSSDDSKLKSFVDQASIGRHNSLPNSEKISLRKESKDANYSQYRNRKRSLSMIDPSAMMTLMMLMASRTGDDAVNTSNAGNGKNDYSLDHSVNDTSTHPFGLSDYLKSKWTSYKPIYSKSPDSMEAIRGLLSLSGNIDDMHPLTTSASSSLAFRRLSDKMEDSNGLSHQRKSNKNANLISSKEKRNFDVSVSDIIKQTSKSLTMKDRSNSLKKTTRSASVSSVISSSSSSDCNHEEDSSSFSSSSTSLSSSSSSNATNPCSQLISSYSKDKKKRKRVHMCPHPDCWKLFPSLSRLDRHVKVHQGPKL